MKLPAVLQPFQKAGVKLLQEGKVKQVEFSGGTYQVEVQDGDQNAWAFIQLDDRNHLKDSFCSCDESEDVAACPHLAAAFLYIFNGTSFPLHKRFEKSLWNKLGYIYSEDLKLDSKKFKPSPRGTYAIYSRAGKQIFVIQGKNKSAINLLKNLLFDRQAQTEETSLKFSNLNSEEIALWKEGKPSPQLHYELSFWSDLAKWLMFLQDSGEKYDIQFEYSDIGIPTAIIVDFADIYCKFYLSQAHLLEIIPALATVNSPLRVFPLHSSNEGKITYDQEQGCLLLDQKVESPKSIEGISLEGWIFVPKKGFYPKDPFGFITSGKISGQKITEVLHENFAFVKEHIIGIPFHEDPIKASYSLKFDREWNLHIQAYVFNPGDLSLPMSHLYGDWAYIENKGFYKLDNLTFKNVETVVHKDEVVDFIQTHRIWLNTIKGFETHLASVEAQLTYKMASVNGPLSFQRTIEVSDKIGKNKDFGSWVYIAGQGFYAKVTAPIGLSIRQGIAIQAEQIPSFIRTNREELKVVPHFFSPTCPIVGTGLDLSIVNGKQIVVAPQYDLLPQYTQRPMGFFDEFIYVEGEGFSELPSEFRLPSDYRHAVTIDSQEQATFINYELKNLKPLISHIDPRLVYPKDLKLVVYQLTRADALVRGWYLLKLGYKSEFGELPISKIWSAIKGKQRFLFSSAGLIDLHNPRFDWLRHLHAKRIDNRSNRLRLSTIELIRLNAFENIQIAKENESDYQQASLLLNELTDFKIPEKPDLTNLNCHLRPYQEIGLHWLWFLYHHGLSGLLCDDMGLGKTHQAMALLASIVNFHKRQNENSNRHFLIVCPTSVIYHWQDKLATFLPELRVCTFYGTNRSLQEFREQYDILLTSYGIWRIENEMLSQIPFEVAIFDEVQIAKNKNSRLHASLTHANAQMRLGLTGTPIENHLGELKALFDLVLPTYMPSEKDYREYFIKPIEKEHDPTRKALLNRLIHPFVLRRKKEDVLTDLPEKTEEISHCGLALEQARMYNDVVERSRRVVLEELNLKDQPIPYIHVFAILSYLKQICDHPACYLKEPDKYKHFQSGKWDLFIELLNEARESKQKVVIFSQYLNMLDIIQAHLEECGIGYASIRGSTTDRGEQLKRFNEDPNCEVFVGSLQASGLGIELTAASVVIHYDRWWNAARENQATDRVHRIGQKKGVQVFKLVTKGTFEEKIDSMITRKGKLMEDIIGVDDHRLLKHFNREEIIDLLQNVNPSSYESYSVTS